MPTSQPAILAALSAPRLSTYLAVNDGDLGSALDLYGWNARTSAALMLPAHFAEVTTQNAFDQAVTAVYGPSWPWEPGFEGSLPAPQPCVQLATISSAPERTTRRRAR